jgi:DNA polymerase-4
VSNEGTILHADADSFYASVEQRDDPSLRGRPVIVGGGVVLAASYEAKAHGVRTPMGHVQALRLCPDAIVVPPRMDAYSEASERMFEVFHDTTAFVEGLSIDEAFLEVGGLRRTSGTPTEIAVRLREQVRERSACRSPWASRGRSSWPRWRAASRNRTGCWSCRSTASSRSCTRCR